MDGNDDLPELIVSYEYEFARIRRRRVRKDVKESKRNRSDKSVIKDGPSDWEIGTVIDE